jgi:hypothetical protein
MSPIRPIKQFNFSNWENVPSILADAKSEKLKLEEKHLLGAIKLAYYGNEDGRQLIMRSITKTSLVLVIICLIGFISLISFSSLSENEKLLKPVSAATVSASLKQFDIRQTLEQAYESTVSAVLGDKPR